MRMDSAQVKPEDTKYKKEELEHSNRDKEEKYVVAHKSDGAGKNAWNEHESKTNETREMARWRGKTQLETG